MKPRPLGWLALLVGTGLHAGPVEEAIVAAMALSAQPSYGWTATVTDDARSYEIHGQTVAAGFTHVRMPVINSVRRRLGRSLTDTQVEVIFRGNVRCVLATDDGWKTVEELPREADTDPVPPGIMPHRSIAARPLPPRSRLTRPQPYSNLQLAISHPHEELAVIVTSHETWEVADGVATGTLNDLGAQLLLVRDGQEAITPLRARGTFKLWLHAGRVTRYQVKLEGVLRVETSHGRRDLRVRQETDTTLKNIGTTRFEVPDEARLKLES